MMLEQEIQKEAVLQMIWDRHFDLGMEKDLDDVCEDIYNEVFVPLLEKTRKKTAEDFAGKVKEVCNDLMNKYSHLCKSNQEATEETCRYQGVLAVKNRIDGIAKQFGVEVE